MIYPEPVVRAFIQNNKGELLLIGSPNGKGFTGVPGGHIELGENIKEALIREVKEETGLEITDICFISVEEYINRENPENIRHFIFFNYKAKTTTNKVVLNDEDATEFMWIKPAKANRLPLPDSLKEVISCNLL